MSKTESRDQLIELQRLLGYVGYTNGIWSMREKESAPVSKAFSRNWRWTRNKVVSLQAYRKQAEAELSEAGNGMGLR